MPRYTGRLSLAQLCYEAAGGDGYLALWLAVKYLAAYERHYGVRKTAVAA